MKQGPQQRNREPFRHGHKTSESRLYSNFQRVTCVVLGSQDNRDCFSRLHVHTVSMILNPLEASFPEKSPVVSWTLLESSANECGVK
jgi:hypothetical protein